MAEAKKTLLNMLARRSYHSIEAKRKLALKGFSPSEINEAVAAYSSYFNDNERVELLISHHEKKGYGPRYILLKLKSKGIILTSAQQRELFKNQLKTLRSFVKKGRFKNVQSLQRRGFDFDTISLVLNIRSDL